MPLDSGRGWLTSATLTAVLGVLLMAGLVKVAADSMDASAAPTPYEQGEDDVGGVAQESTDDGGAGADPCPGPGLAPVGDTGLCTHGPDEPPPGSDVPGDGEAEIAGAAAPPAIDCVGDGRTGKRVQVLYARASDVPSRLSEFRTTFERVSAEANQIIRDGAAETGGRRSIRFVHDGSCRIDIREVVLSPAGDDTFYEMITDLAAKSYDAPNRKYLVFVDAEAYCGVASLSSDDRRDAANEANLTTGYARLDTFCWRLPDGVAHELLHTLGAVQSTAPNATSAGHCTDEYDIMCYQDSPDTPEMRIVCPGAALDTTRVDCRGDDYFSTNPPAGSYLATRWNSANSQFLIGAVDQPVLPPPANDDFDTSVRVSTRTFTDSRIVSTATVGLDDPQPTCLGYQPVASVWYRTTPTSSGPVAIDPTGTRSSTVISVWTGTRGNLRPVTCAYDPFQETVPVARFTAVAGTTYHIMVAHEGSYRLGDLRLKITGPGEAPVTTLALDKEKSKYNGLVEATLSGFTPNASVTLRWPRAYELTSGPNKGQFTDLLASGRVDAGGRATLSFRTPLEPYGDYVVTARDSSGGKATSTLRVIPRILLNEGEGPTTTKLRVYFYGFGPNERIEVRWHTGATTESSSTVLTTLTVAGNGRASSLITIPADAAAGEHLIVGKVIGVSRSASTSFEVTGGGSAVENETANPTATATATAIGTPAQEPTATATSEPQPTQPAVPTETPTQGPTATAVPDASPVADAGTDQAVVDTDE